MAGVPSEFHEQKIPAAWAQKRAGASPSGGRRAHSDGEMFPGREIAAAWAQKGAAACLVGAGGHISEGKCSRVGKLLPPVHKKEPGGTGRGRAGGSEGQQKRQFPGGKLPCIVRGEEITPTRLLRLVLVTYRSIRGSRLEPLQGFCL